MLGIFATGMENITWPKIGRTVNREHYAMTWRHLHGSVGAEVPLYLLKRFNSPRRPLYDKEQSKVCSLIQLISVYSNSWHSLPVLRPPFLLRSHKRASQLIRRRKYHPIQGCATIDWNVWDLLASLLPPPTPFLPPNVLLFFNIPWASLCFHLDSFEM